MLNLLTTALTALAPLFGAGFARPTSPDAVSELVSTTSYDTSSVPNVTSTTTWGGSGTTLVSRVSHEVLDGFGGAVQTWAPNVDGSGFIVSEAVSDPWGRALFATEPRTEGAFALPALPVGVGQPLVSRSYWDGMGRLRWSRTDAAEATITSFPQPGWAVTVDAEGHTKKTVSDTHGRLKRVEQGQGAGALTLTGTYTYDGRGRVGLFTDGRGDRHRYAWDGVGRLASVFRREAGQPNTSETRLYCYNYAGPWVREARQGTCSDGTLLADWTYDALGRTTQKRVRRGGAMESYYWAWDEHPDTNLLWMGVRHQTRDPEGRTDYFYDESAMWGELGRLTSLERTNDSQIPGELDPEPPLTFHYAHDFEGQVISTEWPTGSTVHTTYSPTGWKVADLVYEPGSAGPAEVASTYGYDEWGLLETQGIEAYGRVWKTQWSRTTPNVLDGVEVGLGSDVIGYTEYGYQANGWLSAKRVWPPMDDAQLHYTYDPLGRIGTVSRGSTSPDLSLEKYTYDAAGTLTSYTEGDGPLAREWDYDGIGPWGQVASRSSGPLVDEHEYDVQSRLTQWKSTYAQEKVRNYTYDGSSRLASILIDGQDLTTLRYDVDDQVVVEDRDGTPYRRFMGYWEGDDPAWDATDAQVLEPLLGNVRRIESSLGVSWRLALVDVDGHAVLSWDLEDVRSDALVEPVELDLTGAYGVEFSPTYLVESWNDKLALYKERLEVDGLHGSQPDRVNEVVHFGARHMLHRDGMWMQPEPLLYTAAIQRLAGNPGASARQYAAGNPLLAADKDGLWTQLYAAVQRAVHDPATVTALKNSASAQGDTVGAMLTSAVATGLEAHQALSSEMPVEYGLVTGGLAAVGARVAGVAAGRAAGAGARAASAASSKGTLSTLATGAGGAARITLDEAKAAAMKHGIDMRMFDLRHDPTLPEDVYGYVSQTLDANFNPAGIVRSADGRIVLTLGTAACSPLEPPSRPYRTS